NVKCIEAYPTLHKVPNNSNGLYYSDHLAVYALFEIDENIPEKKPIPSLEHIDIVDEETQNNLRSACLIVEESIQRIQRDRMFFALGVLILIFILFSFNNNSLLNFDILTIVIILKNLFCLIGISISIWFIGLGKPVERNCLSSARNAMHLRLRISQFIH
ncbi:unnamed protein product, partial [Rotaria sp. Silwood2]